MGCEIWHLIENYFLFFFTFVCFNIAYITTSTVIICFNQQQRFERNIYIYVYRWVQIESVVPYFLFLTSKRKYVSNEMKLTLDDGRIMFITWKVIFFLFSIIIFKFFSFLLYIMYRTKTKTASEAWKSSKPHQRQSKNHQTDQLSIF